MLSNVDGDGEGEGAATSSGDRWILPALVSFATCGGVACFSPVFGCVIATMLRAGAIVPVSRTRISRIEI